jgi:hypothetical protein
MTKICEASAVVSFEEAHARVPAKRSRMQAPWASFLGVFGQNFLGVFWQDFLGPLGQDLAHTRDEQMKLRHVILQECLRRLDRHLTDVGDQE